MNPVYLVKKASPQEYSEIGLLEYLNIRETDPTKNIDIDHFCEATLSMAFDSNTSYFFVSNLDSPEETEAGGGVVLSLDPFYGIRGELQAFFVMKTGRRKGHASRIIEVIKNIRDVQIWNTNIFETNIPS